MKFSHLALVAPTALGSSSQDLQSHVLENLTVPGVEQLEVDAGQTANLFSELTVPEPDGVSSRVNSSVVSVLLPDVGFRKVSKGKPSFHEPSKWSAKETKALIQGLASKQLSSVDLRNRYNESYFHPKKDDIEAQASYDRLLAKTEVFVELAIYSGLYDDEIRELAGFIRGRGEFGERDLAKLIPKDSPFSPEVLQGWLGLYERAYEKLIGRVDKYTEGVLFADEAIGEGVVESLAVLQLYSSAVEILELEKQREMTQAERSSQVRPYLAQAAYFLANSKDFSSYKKALKGIAQREEQLQELRSKEWENGGLTKRDQKNRARYEKDLAEYEGQKEEIAERMDLFSSEFKRTIGADDADKLPLDTLRRELGARFRQ